jgi:hypothetical protein
MVPSAPIKMTVDAGAEHTITLVMAVLAGAALIFALIHWMRSGRPIVLLMFLAGGCMMIMEPMVDTVGGCWFAANSTIAFWAWGRPIPVWLCLTYFVYFGVGGGVTWIAMRRGLSMGQILLIFCAEMVVDLVLESVLLLYAPYTYYGPQPLLLGSFPLWWAPVNGAVGVIAAAVTLRLAQTLSGWRLLLIIPALVSTSAAVNAAAGWPAWFVINTNVGPVLTQVGGLATFALAGAIVWWASASASADVNEIAGVRTSLLSDPRRA